MTISSRTETMKSMIVCVDGLCYLCDKVLQFIARNNTEAQFMWIQHPKTGELMVKLGVTDLDTVKESMVVIDDGKVYRKSDALIHVLGSMQFFLFRLVALILNLIPLIIRNTIIRFVASRRYKFLGAKPLLGVPDKNLAPRFLHEVSLNK